MKLLSVIIGISGALVLAIACTTTGRSKMPIPADNSLLQLLRDAERSDRINARLYTWSAPSLDHYYNLKADQLEDIIRRFERGEKVPAGDISHALDNSLASTFAVPVY
jgi:hypothetical protein